jgi:hypothetical protein
MAKAIFDALGPVLTHWMTGAPAAPAVPSAWRDAIGSEPGEAELRLLALSGQFLAAAVVAKPQSELRALPDVPVLALPMLPLKLRPLARRMVEVCSWRNDVLHFLAGRGWTMHPEDWMPSADDEDVPAVYAPWREWAQAVASNDTVRKPVRGLTADNWRDYRMPQRAVALADLRRRIPDAARALLEANFAHETNDARFSLLRVLAQQLSKADAPFLERVAIAAAGADSREYPQANVQALAASLLVRLGRGSGTVVAELASFFELRRMEEFGGGSTVAPRAVETSVQRARRSVLFADAEFDAFAGALGFSSLGLVEAWSFGADVQADVGFAAMASRSAADEVVVTLAAALAEHAGSNLPPLFALVPRLDEAWRIRLAQQLLRGGCSFPDALALGGVGSRIDGAIDMPASVALIAAYAGHPADWPRWGHLEALGLIASRAAARQALEQLKTALAHDLVFQTIRLNAELDDNGGQG